MYSSDRPGSVPLYNMFSCLIGDCGVLARGKGKLCDVLLLIFLLTGCLWMVSKTNTNIIFFKNTFKTKYKRVSLSMSTVSLGCH